MEIITGHTGSAHIKAEDDRALISSIFACDAIVLKNDGNSFSYSFNGSNTIVIMDGDLLVDGTLARIRPGETESINIEQGTVGYNRIDLICARYTNNNGIENMQLVVVKGDATTGTPSKPSWNVGRIINGDNLVDIPLYSVKLTGVNIVEVSMIPPLQSASLSGLEMQIKEINENTIPQLARNLATFEADISENIDNIYKHFVDEIAGLRQWALDTFAKK